MHLSGLFHFVPELCGLLGSTLLRSGVRIRRSYFHLHLISDSTGETLTTIAKAAAAQYAQE